MFFGIFCCDRSYWFSADYLVTILAQCSNGRSGTRYLRYYFTLIYWVFFFYVKVCLLVRIFQILYLGGAVIICFLNVSANFAFYLEVCIWEFSTYSYHFEQNWAACYSAFPLLGGVTILFSVFLYFPTKEAMNKILIDPLQPSVAFHLEATHFICDSKNWLVSIWKAALGPNGIS